MANKVKQKPKGRLIGVCNPVYRLSIARKQNSWMSNHTDRKVTLPRIKWLENSDVELSQGE